MNKNVMKKKNIEINRTYCLVIINDLRLVTLNRLYLPTFNEEKIEGVWTDEYINSLFSSSVEIGKEIFLKLSEALNKEKIKFKTEKQKDNKFIFYYLYNDASKESEIEIARNKVNEILERITGKRIDFYE